MSRRIQIFDTTLRDGELSPGIALRPHEKAEIALQLERLGVDVVEAGHPGASRRDFDGVRAVAAALSLPVVAAAARAQRDDLDAAADALAGARRSRINVRVDSSEPVESARRALEYAASRADEVQLSLADATRAEPALVAELVRAAVAAGAGVVGLGDDGGQALPGLVSALVAALPSTTVSVHCHDDLGLAVANTLAGVEAGAAQVECTVNGIGERAGNAPLEEVVVALKVRRDHFGVETGVDTREIAAASRLVAARTGCAVQPNKAVVGANAFAHEAGIHQDGMLKDERTYQIIDPAEVGLRMTLPLGKHSGRHAFAKACAERGFPLAGDELNEAFRRFKALADTGCAVQLDELFEGVIA